eukprot:14968914-Alexandrium_andersonii.AAC.1
MGLGALAAVKTRSRRLRRVRERTKLSLGEANGLRGRGKDRKLRWQRRRMPPWTVKDHTLLAIGAREVRDRSREHECFGRRR